MDEFLPRDFRRGRDRERRDGMEDVAVVGGGLIGLSCALELAELGFRVEVFDDGRAGQASWAAAGILAPQSEVSEPSPLLELCRASFALYPEIVEKVGADVGFRRNGTLHRAFTDDEAEKLRAHTRWQRAAGLRVEEVGDKSWFFPDERQVDNRKLLVALRSACERRGVRMEKKIFFSFSGLVVRCAGAWSPGVHPVKGQMLALDAPPPPQVVFGGGGYLVPRGDRTLVGATSEDAGFDAAPTEAGRAYLLEVARKHGYGIAGVVDHWAG